jgi:glycosyltransferase involved in cell wall biosynthesis
MTFSIATPVFNGMPWLPCCIRSVSDQAARGRQVEHIVHDGGSNDGSLDVLATSPHLRWTSGPDGGMYDAINRCWRQATGEICSYLNADEQYLPSTLGTIQEIFENDPNLDLIFGDAIVLDRAGTPVAYRRVVSPCTAHTRIVHLGTMSCSMFFRRRLLEKGFYFDTRWKAIGDAEWVFRVVRSGTRIRAFPKPLAAFTLTGGNLGAKPAAIAEATRWKSDASPLLRHAKLALKLHHWLRKLVSGAYMQQSLNTALYLPDSGGVRTPVRITQLPARWPKTTA